MRASLATVIPLAAGQFLPQAGAETWMSLGGFNGALSDRGGSYRTRALTMAVLTLSSAAVATLGVLVEGRLAATLVLTFCIAFGASLMRVWGNAGISIGSATLTVFVVSLAVPSVDGGDAATRFFYVILGGSWAMGIALVLWPLRPYRPARVAVSRLYTALAEYTEQVAEQSRALQTTEWPVQATPAVITNVRTALEAASAVLVQIRRGRPGKVDRGERLLVLSESADQLFAHVIALGEALATLRGSSRVDVLHDRCLELLLAIARTCREVATGVEDEGKVERVKITWSGDDLRALMTSRSDAVNQQYEHVAVILDRAAQFAS
ncbi:MAG: FUSC family membrane protein, partial [Gemmatimonadaceae bacterium]